MLKFLEEIRMKNKKWTIQVYYTANDDNGKQFRAISCFQCEAPDLPSAYKVAENADWGGHEPVKFGAIVPGWVVMK